VRRGGQGGLNVAATIAWVWAVIYGLIGLALGAAAVARNGIFSGQALFHVFLAALAVELFHGGRGLQRGQRSARWTVLVVGLFQVLLPFAVPAPLMWAGAVVCLPVVVFVIVNWRRVNA